MSDALGAAETKDLLNRHGLRPRTTLGQHFIVDPNTIRRIVSDAQPAGLIIEVGPGLGTLTRALAATGLPVLAVERDRGLQPVLEETVGDLHNVTVVYADAMKFDFSKALDEAGHAQACMVANLPYQIATGLVLRLLETEPRVRALDVMVQKEAGDRLVASPGSDAYGAVSVKVKALADARITYRVSRNVFLPMPEVESVMVRLERRDVALENQRALWRVIEAGFGQRRKTLRRALAGGGFSSDAVANALEKSGVSGSERAEQLSLEQFASLAAHLGT